MASSPVQDTPWSPGGIAAAGFVLVQVGWAFVVLTAALPLAYVTLLAGIGAGVVAIVVLARCRLPLAIKAALAVAQVAALLMLVAARDLSGLRAVQAAAAVPMPATATSTGSPVSVRGAYSPVATRAAAVVGQRLAGAVGDATVELTATRDGAIDWTIRRGPERLWCGAYSEANPEAAGAFGHLGERVAAAVAASRDGALACE